MATRSIRSVIKQRILECDRQAIKELSRSLRPVAEDLKRKHQAVVKDWSADSKPRFEEQIIITARKIEVRVRVAGRNKRIYRYVDEGTRPHIIAPRDPKGHLAFQGGYSAKTAPVAKFAQGDGGRTGEWSQVQIVNHPGTTAREFSQTFSDEIRPDMEQAIDNSLRRAIRRGK